MNTERAELVVVGAGPAGLSAAIEAARVGLEVGSLTSRGSIHRLN